MNSVRFQGKPFNITVIQAYAPTSITEEAGVEQFYELFLELTPPKKMFFNLGDEPFFTELLWYSGNFYMCG